MKPLWRRASQDAKPPQGLECQREEPDPTPHIRDRRLPAQRAATDHNLRPPHEGQIAAKLDEKMVRHAVWA